MLAERQTTLAPIFRVLAAIALISLAAFASGCGGSEVQTNSASLDKPALTVPQGSVAASSSAKKTGSTGSTSSTTTDSSGTGTDTGADTGGADTGTDTGGADTGTDTGGDNAGGGGADTGGAGVGN